MTQWRCPGCDLELEAVAVACGHECPGRRGTWVDLTATDVTATPSIAPRPRTLPSANLRQPSVLPSNGAAGAEGWTARGNLAMKGTP